MKSEIILLAGSLAPGDTIREMCPRCDGGSTRERSLSITLSEDGQVLWQCFRSKCPEKGYTGLKNTTNSGLVQKPKPRAVFEGKVEALNAAQLERIRELWGITNPLHWWWTPDHGGRVAMSIRSPKYVHRGWVLRDIYGRSRIKALTYVDQNEEGISWYKTKIGAPTMVVEDLPSAIRASGYVNAVALLGTGIGLTRADEINLYAPRPIVIALDQDATAEAFRIAHKWALLWGDVKVLPLKQDLKNMEEEALCKLLTKL